MPGGALVLLRGGLGQRLLGLLQVALQLGQLRMQLLGRQPHHAAERPFLLEELIAPGIVHRLVDLGEDVVVMVGLREEVLHVEIEGGLHGGAVAMPRIDDDGQGFEMKIGANLVDEGESVAHPVELQAGEKKIDARVAAQEGPGRRKVVHGHQTMIPAGEDASHGPPRRLAWID
jgi:hypothetical protein